MSLPSTVRFTATHEWILPEGGVCKMGISDFAQDELGELVFVDLPKIGTTFSAGDSICVVESTKAASDVYAPVSGEIVAVNSELESTPSLVNEAPFTGGWLVQIKMASSELEGDLLTQAEYETHIGRAVSV